MTDEQILTKAIEKALASGWTMFGFVGKLKSWNVLEQESSYQSWLYGRMDERLIYQLRVSLNDVLYDHSFAKAFWGEKEYVLAIYPLGEYDDPSAIWHSPEEWEEAQAEDERITDELIEDTEPAWKHHLQQMVTEKDPLQYLAKFL